MNGVAFQQSRPCTGLRVSKLCLRGRGQLLENGFSAEFLPARIHLLAAPNGAGKSSLLASLAGLLKPDSGGSTFHNGSDVVLPHLISWLPPDDDFVLPQAANEIVQAGRWRFHRGRPSKDDREIARFCLDSLGFRGLQGLQGLQELHARPSSELSSGQKRRVNLARVLAQDADILLLDEPFRGLDHPARESCQKIFELLAGRGRTVIIADPSF